MISSSLNSNVSQRTEFFGLMRCLGATRRQVLRFVRREALHWCVTSIPIGIGLSIVVVWGLCAVMRRLSSVWFGYMPVWGISWLSIAVSIVLGIVTVLLAARSPAKFASKVSPLEAVTGSAHQNTTFRHAANTHRWKVDVALGIHHAKAKRSSYLLMTCAFAICLTLFLGFCTLVPFMKNAFMPKEWASELSIVSESNTCSIPFEQRDAVSEVPAVSRVFGRMFAYDVPAEIGETSHNSNLISYEENQFRWAQDRLTSGSVDTVANTPGQVLFVANTGTQAQVGDTVTLKINGMQQTVTIGGVLNDDPLAREEGTETLICSEETFMQLTGENGYTILDVQFRFGAGKEDVKAVEALFTDGVTFTDTLTRAQQQRGLYYAFSVLVYGFLSIIVAITVFHMRVAECTGLTKNDVDLENNTISVNHNLIYRVIDGKAGFHITTPKTASGTRTIPILYPQVAEQLRTLIEVMDTLYPEDLVMNGYHGFLFRNREGYFLSAHNINRAIQRISIAYNAEEMDQAELEDREPELLPHFSVHNMRHTFCTRLCESTNDIKFIQQVMGHADFSTTMDIYTHITQENMREKAEAIKGNLVLM